MKFAIIAAGEGSRLAEEGISAPKPLIPLCGTAMIERLVRIFAANDAEEIVIIVNRLRPETESFVRRLADEHPEWNLRIEVGDYAPRPCTVSPASPPCSTARPSV